MDIVDEIQALENHVMDEILLLVLLNKDVLGMDKHGNANKLVLQL
jgi:hypothetical protein